MFLFAYNRMRQKQKRHRCAAREKQPKTPIPRRRLPTTEQIPVQIKTAIGTGSYLQQNDSRPAQKRSQRLGPVSSFEAQNTPLRQVGQAWLGDIGKDQLWRLQQEVDRLVEVHDSDYTL